MQDAPAQPTPWIQDTGPLDLFLYFRVALYPASCILNPGEWVGVASARLAAEVCLWASIA